MNICDYLETIDFSTQLSTINDLLESAQPDVTFWGERVVTVATYEGSFSLKTLASKISQAALKRCFSDDLTTEERVAGIDLTNKLKAFYQVTDTKIAQTNRFQRFLNWAREFTLSPYTPRFHIEEGSVEGNFRSYSEFRFSQKFGEVKSDDPSKQYENSDGSSWLLLLTAEESSIRAKLS